VTPLLTITVYGQPAPQGSKRHVGRGIMVESSKAVKPWREAVKAAALDARGDHWTPVDAPLAVSMVFTMPKPVSAPKRRRTWPMRTPDLSKLIRSTEDALTDAGIWRDDARVVSYERTAKVYPGEGADSLTSPGVVIRIWAVNGTPAAVPFGDDRSLRDRVVTVPLPAEVAG
jgi:Holliday junction resolvase RusA-like endonuclease